MTDLGPAGWPSGIDAITLFVEDLGETKAWYSAVFAKQPLFEDPNRSSSTSGTRSSTCSMCPWCRT